MLNSLRKSKKINSNNLSQQLPPISFGWKKVKGKKKVSKEFAYIEYNL